MRYAVILIAAFLMAAAAHAQEQTLLGDAVDVSGYGGMLARMTTVKGHGAAMVGAGGGVIIGHRIVGSFVGYSLATDVEGNMLDTAGQPLKINLACGGLKVEYILNSDEMLHLTAGALLAGGTVSYSRRNWFSDYDSHDWDRDREDYGNGALVVIEPEIGAEANITRWFRVAASASYRWASGVDYGGLTSSDLSGPSVGLMLKFGRF